MSEWADRCLVNRCFGGHLTGWADTHVIDASSGPNVRVHRCQRIICPADICPVKKSINKVLVLSIRGSYVPNLSLLLCLLSVSIRKMCGVRW